MKKLLILASVLLLAACEDKKPQQKALIESQLPDGCVFVDLGKYGAFNSIVAVICKDATTTTQGFVSKQKGQSDQYAITIQGDL
jgi:uncharacterized lipoprotein YajG